MSVVSMRLKGEVLKSVNQFAKYIVVPDDIFLNASGEQKSHAFRSFCNNI